MQGLIPALSCGPLHRQSLPQFQRRLRTSWSGTQRPGAVAIAGSPPPLPETSSCACNTLPSPGKPSMALAHPTSFLPSLAKDLSVCLQIVWVCHGWKDRGDNALRPNMIVICTWQCSNTFHSPYCLSYSVIFGWEKKVRFTKGNLQTHTTCQQLPEACRLQRLRNEPEGSVEAAHELGRQVGSQAVLRHFQQHFQEDLENIGSDEGGSPIPGNCTIS